MSDCAHVLLTTVHLLTTQDSPKLNIPPASAYDPPPLPSLRDLGPPPPGYGRYADFDHGPGSGMQPGWTLTHESGIWSCLAKAPSKPDGREFPPDVFGNDIFPPWRPRLLRLRLV